MKTLVDWARITDRLTTWMLPPYFAAFSGAMALFFIGHGLIGIDARIYARAAATWMSGGDPWHSSVQGFMFAAPPPTLIPFVPFALLGETSSGVLWVLGSLVAGILLIRQLGLPAWWILFPPLVNGILAGNPDVVLVALLVMGGPAAAAVATYLKIYAFLPLIGERRWRALLVTGGTLLVTVPLLPWQAYLNQSQEIAATLARQSISLSSYGTVWLMGASVIALAVLGWRSAGWLAVPALWPYTQLHYSVLALPALRQAPESRFLVLVAALLLAPEIRWLPAIAVIVLAVAAFVRRHWGTPAAGGQR